MEEEFLERIEMRMLQWMLSASRRERFRNEEIHKGAGVVSITKRIREMRILWFELMMRKKDEEPFRKAWNEQIRGKRSRG